MLHTLRPKLWRHTTGTSRHLLVPLINPDFLVSNEEGSRRRRGRFDLVTPTPNSHVRFVPLRQTLFVLILTAVRFTGGARYRALETPRDTNRTNSIETAPVRSQAPPGESDYRICRRPREARGERGRMRILFDACPPENLGLRRLARANDSGRNIRTNSLRRAFAP